MRNSGFIGTHDAEQGSENKPQVPNKQQVLSLACREEGRGGEWIP